MLNNFTSSYWTVRKVSVAYWSYLNFHMYQYAIQLLRRILSQIWLDDKLSSRFASRELPHSLIKSQDKEYCKTGMLLGLSFHRIHNIFRLGFLHKILKACRWFSEYVIHSRFSSLLSFQSQFLWFTVRLFSGLSKNVLATNWCTINVIPFLFFVSRTVLYTPLKLLTHSIRSLLHFPVQILRILPNVLAWYKLSYSGISSHISIIKKYWANFCRHHLRCTYRNQISIDKKQMILSNTYLLYC